MSSKPGPAYRRGLGIWPGLLATALVVGAWALLAPGSFYEDFTALGRGWIYAWPPYDEHLLRDVGALNLALAVLRGPLTGGQARAALARLRDSPLRLSPDRGGRYALPRRRGQHREPRARGCAPAGLAAPLTRRKARFW